MSRTTTVSALAAALVTALLLGTLSIAAADDAADARTTTIGYYVRTTAYYCTGDVACFPPEVIIRCKAGDFATGGSAWMTNNPGGNIEDYVSRPWRKNGAARGWMIDDGGGIGPDDQLTAQVICARQG